MLKRLKRKDGEFLFSPSQVSFGVRPDTQSSVMVGGWQSEELVSEGLTQDYRPIASVVQETDSAPNLLGQDSHPVSSLIEVVRLAKPRLFKIVGVREDD